MAASRRLLLVFLSVTIGFRFLVATKRLYMRGPPDGPLDGNQLFFFGLLGATHAVYKALFPLPTPMHLPNGKARQRNN